VTDTVTNVWNAVSTVGQSVGQSAYSWWMQGEEGPTPEPEDERQAVVGQGVRHSGGNNSTSASSHRGNKKDD